MNRFIPLSVPNLNGNEQKYVNEAVVSEWVSTAGSFVKRFEEYTAEYLGVSKTVACQSGTSAIHLALIAGGVESEQEVIVPTLTFIAAVNPVSYIGAKPIFMDCDDSLCMDPIKLEIFCENECTVNNGELINKKSSRRIKAIVVVHVFGNMADMENICRIAQKYNLLVIEDATEALGTRYESGKYKGRYAGTIGDVGAYSFNGNKIITTGGGGLVVAKDAELLDKIRYLSTQAKDDTVNFIHNEIGYNYRMTNLQAALGVAQMEQLEDFIQIKKHNYEGYQADGVKLLPFRDGIRPNYWFYSYMAADSDGRSNKENLIAYLAENNIQARPVWGLINRQKPYKDSMAYKIEKAAYYEDYIVNIPCSSNLSIEEIHVVAEKIKELG